MRVSEISREMCCSQDQSVILTGQAGEYVLYSDVCILPAAAWLRIHTADVDIALPLFWWI